MFNETHILRFRPAVNIGSSKYLFFLENALKKNYWIFSEISKVQSFRLIMENNFIQMAASAGHALAYTIGPIFKHIIDCAVFHQWLHEYCTLKRLLSLACRRNTYYLLWRHPTINSPTVSNRSSEVAKWYQLCSC